MVADDRCPIFVDVDVAAYQMDAQAADMAGFPIVARHFVARGIEPDDFRRLFAVERFAVEETTAMERGLFAVNSDQSANKIEQFSLAIIELPVKPGEFVILAIGIVVSALGVAD